MSNSFLPNKDRSISLDMDQEVTVVTLKAMIEAAEKSNPGVPEDQLHVSYVGHPGVILIIKDHSSTNSEV